MLEICHEGLLERCKRPGGGHRRILSDPYPLGSSKLSSDKDERFKSPLEFDIYSLSQHGTLSNAIGGGLCDFKIDGDTLTEGDSESGLSFNLTKPIGRPLHQVKSASSTDLLQSGTSSYKIGIWDDLSSETNEKVATPTSEFLDANTSLSSTQEEVSAAPLNLNDSTQHTLEQASIPLSPNDSITNYGLNDFPLVMPRHGDGCIEEACESMNEMLLKAIASRELGIKKGDDLGDGGSSSDTSFNRDKGIKPWFNSGTMKWEGFADPDLSGFMSEDENIEGSWEGDTTTSSYPCTQQDLARRTLPPRRRQEEADFISSSDIAMSELITTSHLHVEDSSSSCSADRAAFRNIQQRNSEILGRIVGNVLGYNELEVFRDGNHEKPFARRRRSRSLTLRGSSPSNLPCCTQRNPFAPDLATKRLFYECEEQHFQSVYRFWGHEIDANEEMKDTGGRLLSPSSWRRLLFKERQPHGRRRVSDRKGDKCSGGGSHHHHCASSSIDGLVLHSTEMGGGYWPSLSPCLASSEEQQIRIVTPSRRRKPRKQFKCSKRGAGDRARQQQVDPYQDCECGDINCVNCVKDNEMERREGGPKSKQLKTRRKEKNVKAMTTKVHDSWGEGEQVFSHHPFDGIEANPNPQKGFHRNACSCNEIFKLSSVNLQPSVGGIITSTSPSSNEGNDNFTECHDIHLLELKIKALGERIALGKEKLDMLLG